MVRLFPPVDPFEVTVPVAAAAVVSAMLVSNAWGVNHSWKIREREREED